MPVMQPSRLEIYQTLILSNMWNSPFIPFNMVEVLNDIGIIFNAKIWLLTSNFDVRRQNNLKIIGKNSKLKGEPHLISTPVLSVSTLFGVEEFLMWALNALRIRKCVYFGFFQSWLKVFYSSDQCFQSFWIWYLLFTQCGVSCQKWIACFWNSQS